MGKARGPEGCRDYAEMGRRGAKNKIGPAERRDRLAEVARKVLAFWPRWRVREWAMSTWAVSQTTADAYIHEAWTMIHDGRRQDYETALADHVARGEAIINAALEAGDLRVAAAMYAQLAKIGGLERPAPGPAAGAEAVTFVYQVSAQAPALGPAPAQLAEGQPGAPGGLSPAEGEARPEGGNGAPRTYTDEEVREFLKNPKG